MKRLVYLVPLAVLLFVLVGLAVGLTRDPSKIPSVLINKPLPAFDLAAVRSDDAGLKTSDLTGRPALLNVYGSWCVTCRVEHPQLLAMKAQGVPIDGLDWKDEPDAAARYLIENGDPYRHTGADRDGRIAIDLGVTGAPETFVVDRHGHVRYKHIGAIMPDDWTGKIKPLMDQLEREQ